ncbi:hypothetical protein BBW65_01045 [Helicobacter enhydrae]|uniref:FxsA family protein n=1 Tax=Helicobacter enhydrae TaxID=222136 RepID=A0A1B1U464_9HELI|nr:FxsA family protein [Helicobacter enhydrae]ANV97485.1 hypothetical protein BBW65_01045 [Helicobacter enhydrae]
MRVFWFLVFYFFLELGGFVAFSHYFGFLNLVLEIILSAFVGIWLLKKVFLLDGSSISDFFREIKSPRDLLVSNLSKTLGAILIILPGVFGDCVGVALQIGVFDGVIIGLLSKFFVDTSTRRDEDADIIDAEIIYEEDTDEKSHHRH